MKVLSLCLSLPYRCNFVALYSVGYWALGTEGCSRDSSGASLPLAPDLSLRKKSPGSGGGGGKQRERTDSLSLVPLGQKLKPRKSSHGQLVAAEYKGVESAVLAYSTVRVWYG
jgi:hypothetical protein